MAVEAQHINLFPPQLLLSNREIMSPTELNTNIYNTQIGYGMLSSGTTTTTTTDHQTILLPLHNTAITADHTLMPPQKTPIKSEISGLTYNNSNNLPLQRKRSREYSSISSPLLSTYPSPHSNKSCSPFNFLGHDLSFEIQQQQFDIDRLVSQHMETVRVEIQERRKKQARRMMETMEEGMMRRLRAKEEEILKIGKQNWALEEKIKSLCLENQIWRDLAQTNEATANALRTNLEQVLASAAQVKDERTHAARLGNEEAATAAAAAVMDDAQSSCGSCCGGVREEREGRRTLASAAQDKGNGGGSARLCRSCGKAESCVLLLPCRHMCLCTGCGSSVQVCPVCKATKNASFHVNMS